MSKKSQEVEDINERKVEKQCLSELADANLVAENSSGCSDKRDFKAKL